jgi:chromosome segregation ATPase
MEVKESQVPTSFEEVREELRRLAEKVETLSARVRKIEEALVAMNDDRSQPVRRENPHDRRAVTERVRFDWQD